MFIFILAMAAAEVSVGLALVLQLYQQVQDARHRRRERDERVTDAPGALASSRSSPSPGFLVLAFAGRRLPRRAAALVGAGSVGLSAAVGGRGRGGGSSSAPPAASRTARCSGPGSTSTASRRASPSTSTALAGDDARRHRRRFLIHLYSTEFMEDDEGYSRFFAYMNLFVGSMLILVLADNLLLLYLGWEGVGLCSYLLIGFWYKDPANGAGGPQGVHRHPRRRHGHGPGAVPPLLPARHARHPGAAMALATGPVGRRLRRGDRWRRPCSWAAPWASRRSCRSRPGCPTPWPAPRRSAR